MMNKITIAAILAAMMTGCAATTVTDQPTVPPAATAAECRTMISPIKGEPNYAVNVKKWNYCSSHGLTDVKRRTACSKAGHSVRMTQANRRTALRRCLAGETTPQQSEQWMKAQERPLTPEQKRARAELMGGVGLKPDGTKLDLHLERVYDRSRISAGLVVRTDKTRRVKCALKDRGGNVVTVDESIVTPPVDEVLIMTRGASWASAQCWEMK